MPRKLTDEQEFEIARRYRNGALASDLTIPFGVSRTSILAALDRQGIERRSRGGHSRITDRRPTAAALRAHYWGGDKPSAQMLAGIYSVSPSTVKRWLSEAGIQTRTISQQRALDIAAGRYAAGFTDEERRKGGAGRTPGSGNAQFIQCLKHKSRAHIAKTAQAKDTREPVPCWWCAAVTMQPHHCRMKHSWSACSQEHRISAMNHRKWREPRPRPLILALLRERLKQEPWKALPRTLETLEKAGEAIGAGDNEYVELMMEWRDS